MKDEKLIRRVLRHERDAAEKLIERYYDEIYRFAYRQSSSSNDPKSEAQDITQEIFISALGSLYSYDPKKASFRTWLYRVANSRIIDSRRKFRPDEVQIDEMELHTAIDFAIDFQNKALLKNIEDYISSKPSDIQRIFRLHLYSDITFTEIAEMVGVPESTVKTKFYRTIKKIKEVFEDEY
jgi:RNA polymerase sigma-70 factor (ECF subfamily)